eukprot:843770-Pelagomonas_calceolata.AAC.1
MKENRDSSKMTHTGLMAYNMKFLEECGAAEAVHNLQTDRQNTFLSFKAPSTWRKRFALCIKTHTTCSKSAFNKKMLHLRYNPTCNPYNPKSQTGVT